MRQPKWLASCTASPSGFVFCVDGGRAHSRSFLPSWLKHRILLYLTLVSMISPFRSWNDFIGSDRDELFLCPIRALKKYLSWTKQFLPGIQGLFFSTGCVKKRVSCNKILLWLRSVISMAHASASEGDCHALRVRTHGVRKVATSLVCVHHILKAGMRSSQSTCEMSATGL